MCCVCVCVVLVLVLVLGVCVVLVLVLVLVQAQSPPTFFTSVRVLGFTVGSDVPAAQLECSVRVGSREAAAA